MAACLVLLCGSLHGDAASATVQADGAARTHCKRVTLKRNGKVVKRDGRPVYRRGRCKRRKPGRCRIVRVKKRTTSGRLVRRNGKPVFVRRRRCRGRSAPKPAVPSPFPAPVGPLIEPPPGAPQPSPKGSEDPDPSQGNEATAAVEPGRETVVTVGGMTLTVPAGTVSSPTTATVKALPEGDPDLGGSGADFHVEGN